MSSKRGDWRYLDNVYASREHVLMAARIWAAETGLRFRYRSWCGFDKLQVFVPRDPAEREHCYKMLRLSGAAWMA